MALVKTRSHDCSGADPGGAGGGSKGRIRGGGSGVDAEGACSPHPQTSFPPPPQMTPECFLRMDLCNRSNVVT